jgi:hypothetical protein
MRTPKGQYRWLNDLPIAEPPDWLIKLIEKGSRTHHAPNAPNAPRNAKYKPVTDDELRELMEGVPNDDQTSWEQWNRVGMALYAATNGSWFGAELFDQWSEKNDIRQRNDPTRWRWRRRDGSRPDSLETMCCRRPGRRAMGSTRR